MIHASPAAQTTVVCTTVVDCSESLPLTLTGTPGKVHRPPLHVQRAGLYRIARSIVDMGVTCTSLGKDGDSHDMMSYTRHDYTPNRVG